MSEKTCPKSSNITETTLSVICGTNGCFAPAEKTRAVPGEEPCDCPDINDTGFDYFEETGVKDGLRHCQSRTVYCDERGCTVDTKTRKPVGGWFSSYKNCPHGYFLNDIVYSNGFPYRLCMYNSFGPDKLKCGKELCMKWPGPAVGTTTTPNCSFWHDKLADCPTGYQTTTFDGEALCDFRMCGRV